MFINTGDQRLEVQLVGYQEDSSFDSLAEVIQVLEPGEHKKRQVDTGVYRITVWDAQDEIYKPGQDVRVSFTESKEDSLSESYSSFYYFDLAQDKNFYVVNATYLYEGSNSLAEAMSEASGLNSNGPIIKYSFNGEKPFLITEDFIGNSNMGFANWGTDLPSEIGAFQAAHALVYTPQTQEYNTRDHFNPFVHNQLIKKIK